MRKNIKTIVSVAAIVIIIAVLAMGAISYFTDYAKISTTVRAGTLDISITNVTEDLTAGLGIMNPGDSNDLVFTVNNDGEKSADVIPILTITSNKALNHEDHEYRITDADGNELTGVLSEDGKTLVYTLDTIVLNGSIEKEDGVTETSHTYRYKFAMDIDAPDTFQAATAKVDIVAKAKQHRNNDGFEDNEQVEIAPANIPMLAANSSWFSQDGATIKRSQVTEIEIVDSIEDSANYASVASAVDTWDASDGMIGTVTAYAFDNGDGTYKLTIAGNGYGCVYANPDSSYVFSDSAGTDYYNNLTTISNADLLNTSYTTSLKSAFICSSLLTDVNVSNWNTSNVTNMRAMFSGCISLDSLDLTNWDVGAVTTMFGMFSNQKSNVYMAITSIAGIANWDTSNVTDMGAMFQGCVNISTLNVSNWDVSSCTAMQAMFNHCESLTQLDVSNWDVSSCTTMQGMFNCCPSLTELNVANWDVSKVTNFNKWFNSSSNSINNIVKELDVSKWDTSSATDMSFMFYGCNDLTELDISDWDVSKVTNFSHMFSNCRNLKSIDTTNWDTSSATSFDCMFNECQSLTTIDVSGLETAKVTLFSQMFELCTNLESIVGMENWDTSSAKSFSEMFSGCSKIGELNFTAFSTTNVYDMRNMFAGCIGLTSLDLSSFDFSGLQGALEMFENCSNLKTIYVSNDWPTDNLIASVSGNEFLGCSSLVGGSGTMYSADHVDAAYAKVDGGMVDPGYFTYKSAA